MVILAHGFPDCWDTFSEQVPPLLAAGYRTACLSMRGYAPSDPGRSWTAGRLGADLIAVADALSPDAPVRLIGHDWGAIAAYAAVTARPERWSHLVSMAVPHLRTAAARWLAPKQLRRSWYMGLFQLPGVAERRLLDNDLALVARLWRDWSPGFDCVFDRQHAIKEAIRPHPGAVLAYYRALKHPWSWRTVLGRINVPTLYLHGVQDGCVAPSTADGMAAAFVGPFEQRSIERAGHFLHLEEPTVVNRVMLEHFQKTF